MLTKKQKKTITNQVFNGYRFIATQEGFTPLLLEYLLDDDPLHVRLTQYIEKLARENNLPKQLQLVNILVNLRGLVVGERVTLTIGENDFASSDFTTLGAPQEVAEYVKELINKTIKIEKIIDDILDDITNQENFIKWLMYGIGRGTWNFGKRLIDPLLHPIDTLHGLGQFFYLLLTSPHSLATQIGSNIADYAKDDPVAFTTEAIFNIALIAISLPHKVPPKVPPQMPPVHHVRSPVFNTAISSPSTAATSSATSSASFFPAASKGATAVNATTLTSKSTSEISDEDRKIIEGQLRGILKPEYINLAKVEARKRLIEELITQTNNQILQFIDEEIDESEIIIDASDLSLEENLDSVNESTELMRVLR